MNSKLGKTRITIDFDLIKINMTDLDPSCKLAVQKTLLFSEKAEKAFQITSFAVIKLYNR
jgi:hypothetical protein